MKGKLGPAKRFGVRYGSTLKHKLAKIEIAQRAKHVCKQCGKPKVKRISYGIWECRSCGLKFTSHAYTPEAPRPVIEVTQSEVHKAEAEAVPVPQEEESDMEEQDG